MTNAHSAPISVGILGASGYAGAELLRKLHKHPYAQISAVGSRQFLGQGVDAAWPQLAGMFPDLNFSDNTETINNCDLVFCATPHGATAPLVKQARSAGKRVIDLSADFRLDMATYETWYGLKHPHPELYSEARYGLVELHRQELKDVDLVAVPGCNSTTVIMALAPLALHNLLGQDVITNVITGVSGAGRASNLGTHYSETNENARPYKVAGTHRHTAEIEATIGRFRATGRHLKTHTEFKAGRVAFNPHLVPMTRGELATCYTRAPNPTELSDSYLLELYHDFYKDDPLVHVQEELPQTKAVFGSDRTLVSVRYDKRSEQIIAFSAIDNLGKGAAGQAVQNFNVVHGFEETLGLQLEGMWP